MELMKGISLFGGFGYSSNVYVIDSELIVDTGLKDNFQEIIEGIRAGGIDPEKIKTVVNTHGHFDHIGGNVWFKENTNTKICAHKLDASKIEKGIGACSEAFGESPVLSKVDKILEEGMKIPTKNYKFKVIHTPGHTSGSICLFEPKKKILISGDTIFADGFGRTDLPTGSAGELRSSIAKLNNLNFNLLLPGHGEIRKGPMKKLLYRFDKQLSY